MSGLAEFQATKAIDRAFAQVAAVQQRMSAHDPNSDLRRLFQRGANEAIKVHPWTYGVIKAAALLNRLSGGIFDVGVGDTLELDGQLPHWSHGAQTRSSAVEFAFFDGYRIRLNRSTRIDLGGIAKGFAVDRAIDVLLESGAVSGCVNAGGDLAIFSDHPEPLVVRHPQRPQQLINIGQIQRGTVATSALYFSKEATGQQSRSPFIDGRTNRRIEFDGSVSVLAPSCMWADALTKIIAIDCQRGASLLKRFDARALIVYGHKNRVRIEPILPHEVRPSAINDGRTDLSSRF